jgi:hypothetical protein
VQEKDAEGVPSAIHDLVKAYLLEETEENYRAIHDRTREIASRYPGIYSMILCCPCVNREIPVEILGRAVPSRVLKYAFRGQAGKSQYLSAVDARDLRSDKDREQHHALLTILQLETVYFSQILTLYALSARQPVLRLPQFSSGLIGNLKQMRQTYLARNSRAFMRELEKFGDALRAQFAPEHLDLLGETRSSSLKIFSDMPIEWMAVNEVPLVYQRPISRLPLTPGNSLLAHYQASESTIHLTSDDIKNILVLNCLDKSDRLFRYPITLAKSLKELGIPHIYRDVSSLQEYLSALSDTKPTILIHFGHGAYSRSDNTGYLYIGSEKTKVWDFSPTVIPAILMLGACDTAILAETHNTPSNAWLALGARTVIGTYFPVEIDLTLVLYTRIIANLFEAIHGDMYVKTWEKLVSKTMILNRYLDYKYQFAEWRRRRRMPRVPPEFAYEYTYLWNQRVGDLTEGYKSCTSLMKTAFERFGDEYSQSFDRFLHETKVIPHTQFFSQLGSPETIFLVKGKKQVFEERLMRYWEERAREDNGLISS